MGELDDHPVGIGDIERAAIAVLQHIGLRFDDPGSGDAAGEFVLRVSIDLQGDVDERARRHLGAEFGLIVRIGELEEGERAAIGEFEEHVAIGALLAEQLVLFAIGRHQREAENVFVEGAGRLQILGHIGSVVQAIGQNFRHRAHSIIPKFVQAASLRST